MLPCGELRSICADVDCYRRQTTTNASEQRDVTLLARRRVLPSGELRCICADVDCYRRRQTPASKTILALYTMCKRASYCIIIGACYTRRMLFLPPTKVRMDWKHLKTLTPTSEYNSLTPCCLNPLTHTLNSDSMTPIPWFYWTEPRLINIVTQFSHKKIRFQLTSRLKHISYKKRDLRTIVHRPNLDIVISFICNTEITSTNTHAVMRTSGADLLKAKQRQSSEGNIAHDITNIQCNATKPAADTRLLSSVSVIVLARIIPWFL